MQRCGMPTSSRAKDIIAMKKDGFEKAERAHYRGEIMSEILTGEPYPQTAAFARAVEWGKLQEKFARAAYEMHREVMVETCGFVLHPDIARFGCSPDGLVDEDGMIQIKCPNTDTHLETLAAKQIPIEHMPQMYAELSCTGRDWSDCVSFDPRLPAHLQLFVKRLYRDDDWIEKFEAEVVHFNQEIESVLARLPKSPQSTLVSILDYKNSDEVEL